MNTPSTVTSGASDHDLKQVDLLNFANAQPEQSPREDADPATRPTEMNTSTERVPWDPLKPEEALQALRESYTIEEKEDALKKTAKIVKDYSEEMVKRWNAEIDTLLVYAGLFSAILTAFNVQSYPLLQPPPPDPTHAVLRQISMQLNSFSVHLPFVNATQSALNLPDDPPPKAPSWTVALNIPWFSALICSLAAASVGIMVMQWLNEYNTGLSGDSLEIARLRQYRLNNLNKWRVAEIVAFLPVLLQIALVLFLAGLLVLLWNLHHTVAIVVSALVGLLLTFMVCTVVLPLFRRSCCYLSTPTYVVFFMVRRLRYIGDACLCAVNILGNRVFFKLYMWTRRPSLTNFWMKRAVWFRNQRWKPRSLPTLKGQERAHVQSSSFFLDGDMTATAYAVNMDAAYLADTAAITIKSLETHAAIDCFDQVCAIEERHYGNSPRRGARIRPPSFWTSAFIHGLNSEGSRALDFVGWAFLEVAVREGQPNAIWHTNLKSREIQAADLSFLSWETARHVIPAVEEWFYEVLVTDTESSVTMGRLVLFRLLNCYYTATLDTGHTWNTEATEMEKELLLKCVSRAMVALAQCWDTLPQWECQIYPAQQLTSQLDMLHQPPQDGSLLTIEFANAAERLAERVRSLREWTLPCGLSAIYG